MDLDARTSSASVLWVGAPGTGKTSLLLEEALSFVEGGADPASLLVLTPSRVSATRFREDFSTRSSRTISTAPVRAWSAYAFDVLRRAHIEGLLPGLDFAPKLLSGPEQDVMIKELLEGHARGEGTVPDWPTDLQEALGTRGFRHEVRDLFDRMAEYDVSARELRELAGRMNQKAWDAAATLYEEYQRVRQLRMPHAFDPSGLIHRASRVLTSHPDFLTKERQRLALVLVDDFQEATPSIYGLLDVLCGRRGNGISEAVPPRVVLTACPETTVQGFRGARPDYLRQLAPMIEGLRTEHLATSYRMEGAIAETWAAVASRLPVVPAAPTVRVLEPKPQVQEQLALIPTGDDGAALSLDRYREPVSAAEAYTVDTSGEEAALIAQLILEDHLYQGRAYGKSAVIVRNSSDVTRIKRTLTSLGVPVKTAASMTPVRDEAAVRPFLDALGLLLHTQKVKAGEPLEVTEVDEETGELHTRSERAENRWGLGAETAVSLLTSRLGGASAMEIRRLRQSLRAAEFRAGGSRHSDDLLVQALMDPSAVPEQGAGAALRRVSRVLDAGRRALEVPGSNAETVLWALWEASGLAEVWKSAALGQGPAADRANRDLDAMIGLFEAANRYVDQMPGATAAQFHDYIDAQDLPMDTLAVRASNQDAVEVMTAALSAGRQWDTVYVAGIQDGSWPNTTIRGSLLNTQMLIDVLEVSPEEAQKVTLAARAQLNRFDEIRLFSTAVSRASRALVLTAVNSVDEVPSELINIACPYTGGEGNRPNTVVRRPMTLRALVAELRQWAEQEDSAPYRADAAARLLHRLQDQEQTAGQVLPGAHPASWWGLAPLSSTEPAFEEGKAVPLSPSRLETIHRSPLDWFVSAARAEAATDAARSIGNLVHAIAEDMPSAPGHELEAELVKRFPQLGLKPGWETDRLLEDARKMVRKFASYVADLPGVARSLVGVEGAFSVLIPGRVRDVLLSGRVDRLEVTALGKFVVVDLKTGKTKPSKNDLLQHPQLAAYQVALEAGAGEQMKQMLTARDGGTYLGQEPVTFTKLQGESGGAYLVQLGGTTKDYGAQPQEPLTENSEWALDLITRAAELIAESYVQARHTSDGAFGIKCKLPDICPLCARGRQVTQKDN